MKTEKVNPKSNLRRLAGIFLVCLLAGCTTVYKAPTNTSVNYPTTNKIPLSVELRLTDELRAAQWVRESMGSTFVMPLGGVLSDHAKSMSRRLFAKVTVTEKNVPDSAPVGGDAALSVKPVAIERSIGATAFGDSVLTVALEWTLTDSNGQLVWVDTIKGQGVRNSGNVFTHKSNASNQIEDMVKDLFEKSYTAISNSPEIRSLARRPR